VLCDVVDQLSTPRSPIGGIFLESHLHGGRQDLTGPLAYGISITDACLGWDATEALLLETAERLRRAP
jgi:3-deoxy-7-phosphoheptulonate synthase